MDKPHTDYCAALAAAHALEQAPTQRMPDQSSPHVQSAWHQAMFGTAPARVDPLDVWRKAIEATDVDVNVKLNADRAAGAQSWLDLHRDPALNRDGFKVAPLDPLP